jgi:adenine phosphoribosyltransferase
MANLDRVRALIRDVPDFPQPGILYKDITPVLADPQAMASVCLALESPYRDLGVTRVVGIESRGFIFGTPVAAALGVGFAPARKPGKLPWKTTSISYELEYGSNSLEMHRDAVAEGDKILVIDDLLATGGTAEACCKLIRSLGAEIVGVAFMIELAFLKGRDRMAEASGGALVTSLVTY